MAANTGYRCYIGGSIGLGGAVGCNIDVLVFWTYLRILAMELGLVSRGICSNVINIHIDSLLLYTGQGSTIGNINGIVSLVLGVGNQGTSRTQSRSKAINRIIKYSGIRYANIQLGGLRSACISILSTVHIPGGSNGSTADIDGILAAAEELGHAYIYAAASQAGLLYGLIYGTAAAGRDIHLATANLASVADSHLVVVLDICYAYGNIDTSKATGNPYHVYFTISNGIGSNIYIIGGLKDILVHGDGYPLNLAGAIGSLTCYRGFRGIAGLGYICLSLL